MTTEFVELTENELSDALEGEDYPPKVLNPETVEPVTDKASFENRIVRLRNKQNRGNAKTSVKAEKAKRPAPPKRKGSFTKPLTDMYTGVGVMLMPFDQPCGTAVMESASQCAEALDNLAYQNESVRRALDSLLQSSAIGTVVVAHLPIIMVVASHHMPGLRNDDD